MFLTLCEDLLERGYDVRFRAEGTSMMPTIQDGDAVTVSPVDRGGIEPGEIVLYRRVGRPIAHRVAQIRTSAAGGVVIVARGDGKAGDDAPVAAEEILGKVVSIERQAAGSTARTRPNMSSLMRHAMSSLKHAIQPVALLARSAAVCACVLGAAVAADAQVLSGFYTGDGTDNRAIGELGFQPDVVIVKANSTQIGVIRTSTMTGDAAKPMTGATALTANLIQSLDTSGFTVGSDARVNSNLVDFYWVAFKAVPGKMKVGTYTGNGVGGRSFTGVGFSPELVFLMSASGAMPLFKNSASTDNGVPFDNGGATEPWFQSLDSDGFTTNDPLAENNSSAVVYHYVAWNELAGQMDVGSFTGDGADNRNITGVGFQPEYVLIRSERAEHTVHKTAAMTTADDTLFFDAQASVTNRVQALQSGGFQVGSDLDVNETGRAIYYMAWGRTLGKPQVLSGSYTGNATDARAITGVGFAPDLVIVKGNTAQTGVFRTSTMIGDASKPATGLTALTANLVETLTADGFTIGTDARVNSSAVVYQWIAFSAGAGQMIVSAYTGNGVDNRSLTGLGFQPEYVMVMSAGANDAIHRSSTMTGDVSFQFDATVAAANQVQALQADGFQVGTDGDVNTNLTVYHYVAWNEIAGKMDVGTYTGNAADNRNITGVGFQPEYVIIEASAAENTVHRPASLGAADETLRFVASANATDRIQALQADGFQVGTHSSVNGSATTYHWMAWKSATFTAVRMGDIDAVRTASGVAIAWRTGYEVDNLGFDVYRDVGGAHTKLTPKLVAGSALYVPAGIAMPAGHSYSWKDDSPVALEKGVQYWLEDVDLSGKRTLHGPIVPPSDKDKGRKKETGGRAAANSPLLDELRQVRREPEEPPSPAAAEQPPVAAPPIVAAGAPIYMLPAASPRPASKTPARVPPMESRFVATAAAPATSQAGAPRATGSGTTESRAATPHATTVTGQPVHGRASNIVPDTSVAAGSAPSDPPPARTKASEGVSTASANPEAPAQVRIVVPGPPPTSPLRLRIRARPLNESVSGSARPNASAEMREQWAIASQPGARISVRTAGWYRLNRAALLSAGISQAIDPRNLRLVVEGVERPMIVRGESDGTLDAGDAVEFYGTGVDTPFTDSRAYWITAGTGRGLRLPVVEARTAGTPAGASFTHIVERKDREIFFAALQNGDEENFFGPLIMDGAATTQLLTLPNVADPPGAAAELEVSLQGVTALAAADDHRVGVLVNGVDVGEMVFDGRTVAVASFPVPHALLTSGDNTVSFEPRGGADDISLIESVRLAYQRAYRADGSQVTLTAAAGQTLTITGFTSAAVRIFDVTGDVASRELLGTVAADGGAWSINFTVPGGTPRRLFVTTSDVVASPAAEQTNVPSTLHQAGQAGDVVMITDAAFASALTPLKNLRQSQGYAVQIVDVEDIYDEFAYGQKTPTAIRDFLRRAAKSWSRPPRFVLLVGNATTDPRDYQGLGEPDLVPTRIVATDVLETASDDWFVDADGDGFADLAAVGRLPARTAAEVATMVDKIVGYELSSPESWHRSVLLVSDDGRNDLGEGDPAAFATTNADAGTLVPSDYQVNHLRRDQDPNPSQTLRTRLSEGAVLVSYQGHGSVDVWRGNLLTAADAATLDNGSRLPLVVAMTCFNGFFHGLFPEESLAEALVRAPRGGAIGVWASSGMTDAAWQASMDRELFRQVFRGNWTSVGDALRAAKKVVGNQDVRRTWIFFGDPALRLKGLSRPPVGSVPTVTPVSAPPPPVDTGASLEENDGRYRRASHVAVRLVDFDGDAYDDAFLVDPATGSWLSALGAPGTFRETLGQFSVAGEPLALRLNDDNRTDLFVYNAQTGQWLQAMSIGDGRFVTSTGSWPAGLEVVSGDLDGNGRDDLFAHHANGSWFQAFPDGDGDYRYRYGSGLPAGHAYAADFNADGRADVFVYNESTGQWTMAFSTNDNSPIMRNGTWTPGWQPVVARLDADNAADLLLWHAESGAWVQCFRDPSQLFVYRTGSWTAGGRVQAIDLNGDGRDELLRYDWRTGDWTLMTLDSAGVVQQSNGLWEIGWEVTPGDLNGDGRQDFLLYNPDTGEWIRRLNLSTGWVDEVSGLWSRDWSVTGRRR